MYVMISPSAKTRISLDGGPIWLSVNNDALLINPGSSVVVYVRAVTSTPIDVLNQQADNTRFTYATPTLQFGFRELRLLPSPLRHSVLPLSLEMMLS